jgi:pyridoxamine 5'-phosphate oxidase
MTLIGKLRTVFTLGKGVVAGLKEDAAGHDPLALFTRWFEDAKRSGILLPETMALATIAADGTPAARMVLLKAFDERGFVFYTNYTSRKAHELEANSAAALLFHWPRPRGSQLGAWASKQSHPLPDRAELERRYRQYENEFRGREIPLPDFWGGYRVTPRVIEFWQGRLNRLHDRVLYERENGAWRCSRLYP